MSGLHERLLAEAGKPLHIWAPQDVAADIAQREHALVAVVELHSPIPCRCTDDAQHTICAGCPGHELADRCRTLRSVAAGLGIETGDQR